jgi:hypothetical protein
MMPAMVCSWLPPCAASCKPGAVQQIKVEQALLLKQPMGSARKAATTQQASILQALL